MVKTTPVNGKWKTFSENVEIELGKKIDFPQKVDKMMRNSTYFRIMTLSSSNSK
jgi:hypothetical protein